MEYIYPKYYEKFKCVADKCPDTCCAGWQIVIDKKSLDKYSKLDTPFGNRLANSIDWEEGVFLQDDRKRCAFLNEDNLCDIYAEAGKDSLCKTCRRYPRHYEEFENVRELSLSLSCPEAAKIILEEEKLPKLISTERDLPEEQYDYFDFLLYTKLLEIRDLYFEVLKNEEYSLRYKMGFLLATAHDIQNRIKNGKVFEIDELLEKYSSKDFYKTANDIFEKYKNNYEKGMHARRDIFDNLFFLEVLNKGWPAFMSACRESLYEEDVDTYICNKEEFQGYYTVREQEYLNLLHYFVYVYMLGAVYDGDLYTKIRFCIVNLLNIMEIDHAVWLAANRKLDMPTQTSIVYKYSREVEHSDLNLKHMEELIAKGREYSYEKMLNAIFLI
ncbi:MAG: YkgJ family cysteine cluster protein [Lachnospiraceae bacterium]|nr:YkgJ family cysteine cluster protein [Lachnospiraceae bacterium]